MERIVYVQLLNEGTRVFRPVSATKVLDNVFKINKSEMCNEEDETWEFAPGTNVIVEEQNLKGELLLVAIGKL